MSNRINRTGAKYYFRRSVPKDLRGYFRTSTGAARTEWKVSFRVTSREEAKSLEHSYSLETDRLIADARAQRQELDPAVDPIPARPLREQEEAEAQANHDAAKQARHDARREVRTLLRQRLRLSTAELSPEEAAARDLINERGRDLEDLQSEIQMLRGGIIELGGLPGEKVRSNAKPALLIELFEGYALASEARPATIKQWRSHIRSFIDQSTIHDALRIELSNVIEWIEWLRTQPGRRGLFLSEKTIRASYLAALRLSLAYGVTKLLLPRNIMNDLKLMKAKKRKRLREPHFNEAERKKLLTACLLPPSPTLGEYHASVRRWVPWLCAYTGGRVGEMLQLRKCDVAQEDGIWAVHVTPQAGDIKTDLPRWVPLHEHLIEQGFLKWVSAHKTDRLFYAERANGKADLEGKPYQSVYNRLREWVREHIPDPDVQPNHAWRHTFKTLSRDHDLDIEIVDVMQGHTPATAGQGYGGTGMKARQREMAKLPRFGIAP